jgi:type I restriction enzyme S subunit
MRFGLAEKTIDKINTVFSGHPAIEKAVLYGSRAKGNYRPGSDIDLTLYGDALASSELDEIITELDELLLPYRIDLSIFDAIDHAKLREHIDRMGVVFYQRADVGEGQGAAVKAGWEEKSVGEILQLEYGKPLDASDRIPDGRYPVYGANGQIDRTNKFYYDKPSIIVGRKGSAGEINLSEEKFWPLDVTYFVTFDEQRYDLRFVFYLLTTLELPKLAKGVKPGINRNDVYSQVTKAPPLPEQQRIVAILDEAFAGIAIARANAEKNRQNARALFESHLQSVFTERGEEWVEKRLGDVCAITSTLVDPRKDDSIDLTHVGAGNIESQTGVFVELKTAREEGLISGKFLFDESMVLYSKIRPYLMKVARPDFNGLCSADMYPLASLPNEITRDYLFHLLLSKPFTDYAIQGSARAGMPKVNREHLFAFRIWLPSVEKQKKLSEKLDALHEETQRLESLYQQKLAALDELKKSLLHQAFSGQL